jgi:hypothetical protein
MPRRLRGRSRGGEAIQWERAAMNADDVLARARSGLAPDHWSVLPLRREVVRRSVRNWSALAVVGFALFIPAAITTIPHNYALGGFSVCATTFLLLALGAVAVGGAGIAIYDLRRLQRAEQYLMVITPDDFVKAEPGRVTHVPMEHVAYVTLRGVWIPGDDPHERLHDVPGQRGDRFNRLATPRPTPRKRGAPSLAFVDTRDDSEVLVATDDAHADLPSLLHLLQIHSDAKQRTRRP